MLILYIISQPQCLSELLTFCVIYLLVYCILPACLCPHVGILCWLIGCAGWMIKTAFTEMGQLLLWRHLLSCLLPGETDTPSSSCKWFPCSLTPGSLFLVSFYRNEEISFYFNRWPPLVSANLPKRMWCCSRTISTSNRTAVHLYNRPYLVAAQQLSALRERLIWLWPLSFDR